MDRAQLTPRLLEETTVVVLAAGLGTRLRPLTATTPKVMLPIAPGLPLLEQLLIQLRQQGFHQIVINVHYLADQIVDYFGEGKKWGLQISYSDERESLRDTAGALKKVEALLSPRFLVLYGDQLHFLHLHPLLQLAIDHDALAALVLKTSDLPQNGDLARLNRATGRITQWLARPHSITQLGGQYLLNTGIYALHKDILDRIPANQAVNLDREIIPALLREDVPVYGYPTDQPILDIGTPEKYAYAQEWYAQHTLPISQP